MTHAWNMLVTPFMLHILASSLLFYKRNWRTFPVPLLLNHCILKLSRAKDKFHNNLKREYFWIPNIFQFVSATWMIASVKTLYLQKALHFSNTLFHRTSYFPFMAKPGG